MEKRRYEQLELRERIEIYRLRADGKSLRCIAGLLGRSAATISRELKRNSKTSKQWSGGYDPQRAQQLMLRRHARGRAHKLERQPELRKQVLQRLAQGGSPEQIAGRNVNSSGPQRPPRACEVWEDILHCPDENATSAKLLGDLRLRRPIRERMGWLRLIA